MDSKTLQTLRRDAENICRSAIEASVPDAAIQRALAQLPPCQGRTVLVSIGKAGWQTAKAAYDALGSAIEQGVVVTKYGHSQGPIGDLAIYEAGHPVPDEHSVRATEAALAAVSDVMARMGADSRAARLCCVISGASETVFFTASLYLGAAGVKRSRYAVPAALVAYAAGVWTAARLV